MAPRYRVRYLDPHFAERFAALPRDAQRRVLELLGEVANGTPLLGRPCGFQHQTGNLSDCRKLYFDTSRATEPRYRLVYRVLPTEDAPREIEVVTVGPRYTVDADGNRSSIYVAVSGLLGDRLP